MRHHAWDHQETTRLRVAVLATQAGKSQVSMVLEMWFSADGGVAGVVTHDISAKDIASIFKHGWVARANVNRIFGKSQAVLIRLSYSRDVDVGYGSCIYSINTYFYHMTSLREKKHPFTSYDDPGPFRMSLMRPACLTGPQGQRPNLGSVPGFAYKIYCRYMIQSQYIDMHAHIYIYTILLNITELVLLFTICLPYVYHYVPIFSP